VGEGLVSGVAGAAYEGCGGKSKSSSKKGMKDAAGLRRLVEMDLQKNQQGVSQGRKRGGIPVKI
jgi:hypothetical protein